MPGETLNDIAVDGDDVAVPARDVREDDRGVGRGRGHVARSSSCRDPRGSAAASARTDATIMTRTAAR